MNKDAIPSQDADFDHRFSFLYRYGSQKCAGSPPVWTQIPQAAALGTLEELHIAWRTAYTPTIGPRTPVDTVAKNNAKKAAKGALRPFVNRYLRCPPVTDIAYPGVHLVELYHIRIVGAGKDDPRSDYGVRVFRGILSPAAKHDTFRLADNNRYRGRDAAVPIRNGLLFSTRVSGEQCGIVTILRMYHTGGLVAGSIGN
jgi:hypothetical protein